MYNSSRGIGSVKDTNLTNTDVCFMTVCVTKALNGRNDNGDGTDGSSISYVKPIQLTCKRFIY